jgi:DNA-binding transcriptional regulator YiaG
MPTLTKEQRINLLLRKTNKNGIIVRPELGNCWEWIGSKKNGYGLYGKTTAHRKSYELFNGNIDKGLFVMHICDNRCCINPSHLKLGTNQDNVQDKVLKGRAKGGNGRKGINASSKLTNENIKEIRENPHDKCLGCLARQFNISFQHVSKIRQNERWNELVEKKTEIDDFWKRAIHQKRIVNEQLGECWETIRDRIQISFRGKSMLAHRIAYVITNGDVSQGFIIRHKCDNSKCINPKHLEPGTQTENIKDKIDRGRDTHGESHHASKINDTIAREIYNARGTSKQAELATRFNVSIQTISNIWGKRSWKHIHKLKETL